MSAIRRCVCPGSFDPITVGHLDVVGRAAAMFDEVLLAVLANPAKDGLFDPAERVDLAERSVAALDVADRVRVLAVAPGRLLVDVCRQAGATHVVKGLRGDVDYAYELPMALMNRHLSGLETVFLPGDPAYAHVSSSLVKQVSAYGGDVAGLVPDVVRDALTRRARG